MPATIVRGTIRTSTDEVNLKLDIADVIDFLSPYDVPLLDLVGRDSLHTPATQIKHEWLEDELPAREGTLGAAYTAGSGTLVLAAGEGKYLYPDDIIRSERIVFRVTDIATDTLTVSVLAGTDANIASAIAWKKIAHAAQEGGVARSDAKKTVMVSKFNYPQIFKDWAVVTGTMEVIDRYGYVSERAYNEEKILKQLAIDCEQQLLYGARSLTAGPPRKYTMGGLFEYVYLAGVAATPDWATVVDNAAAQLTETRFNDLLQEVWALGGQIDTVLVNGFNKRTISAWATSRIRTERDERTAGAYIVYYESEFGTVEIMLDRWLDKSDVIGVTVADMGIGPLPNRQWSSRHVPSSLDGTWYEVLGEYTQEIHRPDRSFFWLYNTATA